VSGVYFGSFKSQRAMGSFQVTVVVVFLDGGAGGEEAIHRRFVRSLGTLF
jgi:hypothetical protein